MEFLRDFHSASGTMSAAAVNTLGVLSQADLFDASDLIAEARRLASRIAASSNAELSAVVAVSGLLAEPPAPDGSLRPSPVASPPSQTSPTPWSGHTRTSGCPRTCGTWSTTPRPRLARDGLLGGRGLAAAGAARLRAWCEDVSGIRDLDAEIAASFSPGHTRSRRCARLVSCRCALARWPQRDQARALIEVQSSTPRCTASQSSEHSNCC